MGDIVLVGAAGRTHRLDLLPVESGDVGDGYRNVLPGYHELRVLRDDGHWHGTGFVVPPDPADGPVVAMFSLDGDGKPTVAPDAIAPPRDRLRDVLARDATTVRAWQAATSTIDTAFLARPPQGLPPLGLPFLQSMFVYVAVVEAEIDAPKLGKLVMRLAEPERLAAAPAAGVELGRSVGAMLTLMPSLAAHLHADALVGALSLVGNARGDIDLIAAASRLQLQLAK
ncbi:MAG TPA: hypothetical protein VIA18_16670 [Polyangia bacterium]|jgi:hypothetical protein|nr:hypothetical protein [Polyangia bacterium]